MQGIYEAYRDLSDKTLVSENLNNEYFSHFHRNMELLYVRSGRMDAKIDNTPYIYEKDEIAFIPSFYMHEFSTPTFSDVLVFLIPYELISDFSSFFTKKTLPPKLDDHKYNQNILQTLDLMLKQKEINNQYTQKGYISIILGLLIQHYPFIKIENTNASTSIVNILMYIEEHFFEDITLDLLANEFGYSKFYLSHLLKQYIGKNFKEYVNIIRIQHMISCFKKENHPTISKIAMQCGFQNMPTFYRIFKKLYDISPKDFFESIIMNSISYEKQNFNETPLSFPKN